MKNTRHLSNTLEGSPAVVDRVSIEDLRPVSVVLRLGHRPERDKRVTTHVALVARAFGASGFILVGPGDPGVRDSIEKVLERWGGKRYFFYREVESYRRAIEEWRSTEKSCVVHLTMYGLPVDSVIDRIRSECARVMVIVGAEKVPREVYELADYNVSIGSQPHSEVSALAVFLDRLYMGRELFLEFDDARVRVVPDPRGKRVLYLDRETGVEDLQSL